MKAASASKKKGVLKKTRNSRTIWNYHIMVLIGMVWLFFFNIVPMFGIVIAFEDYNPMSGLWHSDFVGMENFAYLFSMSDCKRVIINTLVIAVAKLILNIIVPLAFALLLNEIRQVKFKKAVQTIVYLPHFLSWVILASVLLEMFGYKGVINSILGVFGIQGKIWFSEENCFRQLVIGSDVWKEFGFNAVIYLAALTGISPELYEAAAIDGAGIWQRIIHIMIPAIKKLAGTLLILQIISVFQIMYEPMVLTKGGPDNASLSLMQLMWQYAFGGSMNYGKASAVAVIVTLILLVMTAIYSYFDRKESDWD